MTDSLLYLVTVLVWGSSWLAIKFQLGVVAPEASLVYRFAISAAIMIALCLATRRPMGFRLADHGRMAALGLFLFSTNYVLVYLASQYLTSGLVAVAFATVIVMTILFGAAFFRAALRRRVVAGAALGLTGIAIVFAPEIAAFDLAREGSHGMVLVLAGNALVLTKAREKRAAALPLAPATEEDSP